MSTFTNKRSRGFTFVEGPIKQAKVATESELFIVETREFQPLEAALTTSDLVEAILRARRCVHGYRIYCFGDLNSCLLCTSKAMFGPITPEDLPPPPSSSKGKRNLTPADWDYLRRIPTTDMMDRPEEVSEEPPPPILMHFVDPFACPSASPDDDS